MIIKRMKHLHELLVESLAKDMTPGKYREMIKKKFNSGQDVHCDYLEEGKIYHNPPEEEHTGERKAYADITWIDYWSRMTGFRGNHLNCSFCNKDIYIDVDAFDAMTKRMENPKTSKDVYQAVGGHFHKNGKDNSNGYIIIPICKSCNGRNTDYDLTIKVPNRYVDEFGAK